ncbi:MAG: AMP-binding protein [Magnetococcus sp. MYC-9]
MAIFSHVVASAARSPDRTAVVCGEESLTFREVVALARKCAAGMHAIGLVRGDAVAILLPNSISFAIILLAAARLGLVVVPMNTTTGRDALTTAFVAARVRALFAWHAVLKDVLTSPTLLLDGAVQAIGVGGRVEGCHAYEAWLQEAWDDAAADGPVSSGDSPFILTMTSGSTGDPKPILLSQETKIKRALAAQALYGVEEGEVILTGTPMYHSLAQRLVLLPLIIGGTAVILPRFSPQSWLTAVERHRVGFTIAVSSQIETIMRSVDPGRQALRSLRCLVSSSAPISREAKLLLKQTVDCALHECYGASEISIATNLSLAQGEAKLHTVGTVCPGVELRILDDDGQVLPVGSIGEIACRTPMAFSGYYGNPAATAAAMRDGFFLTGDMGRLDEDGFLVLAGRKKEIIITGGINVYPGDVEGCLTRHAHVKECVVLGVADSHLGEAVLAVVVPHEGVVPDARDLRRFALRQLADYQQPMAYEFVDALPRNPMGKIMRRQLAERYRDYDATARMRAILGGRNTA